MIEFFVGDCREVMRGLPERSVHAVVTSPPYWGLRSYGCRPTVWGGDSGCDHLWADPAGYVGHRGSRGQVPQTKWASNATYPQHTGTTTATCERCGAWRGELGHEPLVEEFISHLVEVFREVKRVLRDDGICWVNIGDSYNGSSMSGGVGNGTIAGSQHGDLKNRDIRFAVVRRDGTLKPKDLCLVPFRLALALQADGWWVRQTCIWHKPNALPQSVTDRPATDYEYLFMLTKAQRYFYDRVAVLQPFADPRQGRDGSARPRERNRGGRADGFTKPNGIDPSANSGRNLRAVWSITTRPLKEQHFAAFPEELVRRCLLASTSEHGCCADCGAPFARVVERGDPIPEWQAACGADASGEYRGQSQKDYAAAGAQDASATKARILAGMVEKRTVGWRATCKCQQYPDLVGAIIAVLEGKAPVGRRVAPCTVLDPFAGSGTTNLVARALGLRSIYIDAQPEYLAIARRRLGLEGEGEEGFTREDEPLDVHDGGGTTVSAAAGG